MFFPGDGLQWSWRADYDRFVNGLPGVTHLVSAQPGRFDLELTPSQVETNVELKPEVFREAFSHVHPAGPGSGGPTEAEARQNKAALMNALGKYGVTNDRLDAVSNYYRYPPGRGGLWKNKPASANALVKNGAVIGYEITSGGSMLAPEDKNSGSGTISGSTVGTVSSGGTISGGSKGVPWIKRCCASCSQRAEVLSSDIRRPAFIWVLARLSSTSVKRSNSAVA